MVPCPPKSFAKMVTFLSLSDMSRNITGEHARIVPELALIKADVGAAALAPASENNTITSDGKILGRRAAPARIAFTKALSERFTAYATAIAAVNDLRQGAWADSHPALNP